MWTPVCLERVTQVQMRPELGRGGRGLWQGWGVHTGTGCSSLGQAGALGREGRVGCAGLQATGSLEQWCPAWGPAQAWVLRGELWDPEGLLKEGG